MKACTIYANRNADSDEMDIDYGIIKTRVAELNELGIDITLQEIGDIIESKFTGKPEKADVRLKEDGALMYPQYTLLRYKE